DVAFDLDRVDEPPTLTRAAPARPSEVARAATIAEVRRLSAERFHSYRQLAAGSAYQLEAPLAKLRASLLAACGCADVAGFGDRSEVLLDALRASERLEDIVHGLMAFAAGDLASARPVDVHEAVDVATRLVKREIDAGARLVRRFSAVPAVRVPLPKLVQVLMAVLRNAAESIPRFSAVANSIVVATREAEDGHVEIEISDTGVGIEDEHVDRVFEPFFTTKHDLDATGLGLTAARSLLLEVGGRIELESVYGRGTTCRIALPADRSQAHRSVPLFASDLPRRRVLAVSDDVDMGCALGDLFEDEHTMVRVATEEEALESLALGEVWDLVVLSFDEPDRGERVRDLVAETAPDVLMRTFEVPVASEQSGVRRLGRRVRAGAPRRFGPP
ncbi:MAG: HAMP domain-containing histidine kinase, partial [Labilithrix sp.]|nr:HAMP domain-containing histidine kinase [Labilithrix sp.]